MEMFLVGADLLLFVMNLERHATLPLIMEKVCVPKMNSKGIDIAITTAILMVIGIVVLIGLIFFVKNGFAIFSAGTEPLLKTQSLEATRQACDLVCKSQNERAFCCEAIEFNEEEIFCTGESLNVKCNIDCSKVLCN